MQNDVIQCNFRISRLEASYIGDKKEVDKLAQNYLSSQLAEEITKKFFPDCEQIFTTDTYDYSLRLYIVDKITMDFLRDSERIIHELEKRYEDLAERYVNLQKRVCDAADDHAPGTLWSMNAKSSQ